MSKSIYHLFCQLILTALIIAGCSQEIKMNEDLKDLEEQREQMVQRQITARGVKDPEVIKVMRRVPRHLFVPEDQVKYAYRDEPRPIGEGQTISQPYIVAFMTEQLELKPGDRVLEIGTGSGYQSAVLACLVDSVFTIEIIPELAERAQKLLADLNYDNVVVKEGDGYIGWEEKGPFDAIIVTAAPPRIPPPLLEQLKIGGRMVLPVGEYFQELVVVSKNQTGLEMKNVLPVRFVPMTGEVRK
ncbi:MAG: protein-L-isoaspartate(D-aspartate) O-methyltransferase [Calditrichaceae bacterium]|nr:protein-L-isoaspartate(D-aspartate) O-methyltransferase [Calditrichaceae bacterium]MBN2707781.1 protein-L-isoaspartate(D-aspartate) O-methyltransferase [Calditrichaceae bacterium]